MMGEQSRRGARAVWDSYRELSVLSMLVTVTRLTVLSAWHNSGSQTLLIGVVEGDTTEQTCSSEPAYWSNRGAQCVGVMLVPCAV